MTHQTVQLHTAFTWTCEECGQDNFERSVTLEPELVKATVAAEDQREIDLCCFALGGYAGFCLGAWAIKMGIQEGRWTKAEVDKLARMWNTKPRRGHG